MSAMPTPGRNYEEREITRITAPDATVYRLQIRAETEEHTRWMNITPAQLDAIREILASEVDS